MHFFDWFQLAGLGLFIGLASYRSVRLRRLFRINAVTPGRASRLARVVFIITWVWALTVLYYVLPLGPKPLLGPVDARLLDWLPLGLAGVLLILLGFALNILAHIALGDSWRLGIDERHPGELRTTGIYARSRNPIYLFFLLYLSGTFLVQGRLVFLLYLLAAAPLFAVLVRQEERFLARAFPDAYPAYRARVRRYWGRTSASR